MRPPLTEWQLELARHCFRFNDSSTYYLMLRIGLGACLGGAVFGTQVVFSVASHTTFLSSFFGFDVLV
jgi:hypothetical protein